MTGLLISSPSTFYPHEAEIRKATPSQVKNIKHFNVFMTYDSMTV